MSNQVFYAVVIKSIEDLKEIGTPIIFKSEEDRTKFMDKMMEIDTENYYTWEPYDINYCADIEKEVEKYSFNEDEYDDPEYDENDNAVGMTIPVKTGEEFIKEIGCNHGNADINFADFNEFKNQMISEIEQLINSDPVKYADHKAFLDQVKDKGGDNKNTRMN